MHAFDVSVDISVAVCCFICAKKGFVCLKCLTRDLVCVAVTIIVWRIRIQRFLVLPALNLNA